MLNDAGFARRRAAELLRKRKSRCEILNDLSAKGIDRDTAAEVVEELFAEDEDGENPELATARALVERQYAAKLAAGKRDQVAAALVRRGFSHAVIRAVLAGDEYTALHCRGRACPALSLPIASPYRFAM